MSFIAAIIIVAAGLIIFAGPRVKANLRKHWIRSRIAAFFAFLAGIILMGAAHVPNEWGAGSYSSGLYFNWLALISAFMLAIAACLSLATRQADQYDEKTNNKVRRVRITKPDNNDDLGTAAKMS